MRRVFLLYCVSGFVTLGYQVSWFRIFVDRFGSTNLSFALVLCSFIGGLGIGGLTSRFVTSALSRAMVLRDPLRLYGVLEILIAAGVLLTILSGFVPPETWGPFPYEARDGVYHQNLLYSTSRILIVTTCVFTPCFLMGVTFPLLCYAFQEETTFPSTLYAWNTLGACSAVLVCEFLLIPYAGHDTTLRVMMTCNLAIGLIFVLFPGRTTAKLDALTDAAKGAAEVRDARPYPVGVALVCAGSSGFLSGGLEADAFKRLGFLGAHSGSVMAFIAFWAVLAIFLGSFTVRMVPRLTFLRIRFCFVLALVVYAVVWTVAYPLMDLFNAEHVAAATAAARSRGTPIMVFDFQSGLLPLLGYVGCFVFLPMYFISLLLPYVCNRLQARRLHLGAAFGLNTVGFCLGVVAFTWIAPRINVFYSLKLFMILSAVIVAFLFLLSERGTGTLWKVPGVAAALGLACSLTPATFDRSYFRPEEPPARFPVSAMKSNAAHTTYVVDHPEGKRLYFENYTMSTTTDGARRYMRLMAHLPLLAHPRPKSALLICFGVGNTASAIATHESIDRIDIVELNDKVYDTAVEFAESNRRVYEDPRVALIHDDGRNFLNLTDRRYDLVTSEPPPPMHHGVYRLYSKEYYASVVSRLTEHGMMTQWLPVRQMPREAVDMAVATFVASFRHTLLFVGNRHEFILVGSGSEIDLGNIETNYHRSSPVVADLRAVDVLKPLHLLARVVKGDGALRRDFEAYRVVSDLYSGFSHLFMDPGNLADVTYDPREILDYIAGHELRSYGDLRRTVLDLGRLWLAVPDWPLSTLSAVDPQRGATVSLAGVNWNAIDRLAHRAEAARAAGRQGDAIAFVKQALDIAAEQPLLLLFLAELELVAARYEAALGTARRLQELEPDDARGFHFAGVALSYLGRYPAAKRNLERAAELSPDDGEVHKALADVLATTGSYSAALRHYDRALEVDPDNRSAAKRRKRVRKLIIAP